jgi:predicted RNA polymerase sigma factor
MPERDWAQIVEWCHELLRLIGSPVVRLNLAVAVAANRIVRAVGFLNRVAMVERDRRQTLRRVAFARL